MFSFLRLYCCVVVMLHERVNDYITIRRLGFMPFPGLFIGKLYNFIQDSTTLSAGAVKYANCISSEE